MLPAPAVRAAAIALAVLAGGCAGYVAGSGGFAADLRGARPGGYLQVEEGLSRGGGPMLVGSARLRVGRDVQELGASFGVALRGEPEVVIPFLRADVTMLQLGVLDGGGSFGMFGPKVEAGVCVRLWHDLPGGLARHTAPFLSLSAGLGYEVRFVGDSAASWQAGLGLGWYLSL